MSTKNNEEEAVKGHRTEESIDGFLADGIGTDKKNRAGHEEKQSKKLAAYSFIYPQSLHFRFKAACIKKGTSMTAELTEFIEMRVMELEERARNSRK